MGRTTRTWRRAALAAAMGVTACAGGGGDDGSPTTTAPSAAQALAERLDCHSVRPPPEEAAGWQGDDVRDCWPAEEWGQASARVYASLTAEERAAAVRLLSMEEAGPATGPHDCSAGTDGAVGIVTGDTWVAVVPGDAALVAERLGGEVHALRVSPPASTSPMACFPP